MNILSLHGPDGLPEFEAFLHLVSGKLAAAICRKMQTYSEFDDVYSCSSLKILNPRIWGYRGNHLQATRGLRKRVRPGAFCQNTGQRYRPSAWICEKDPKNTREGCQNRHAKFPATEKQRGRRPIAVGEIFAVMC